MAMTGFFAPKTLWKLFVILAFLGPSSARAWSSPRSSGVEDKPAEEPVESLRSRPDRDRIAPPATRGLSMAPVSTVASLRAEALQVSRYDAKQRPDADLHRRGACPISVSISARLGIEGAVPALLTDSAAV